MKDVKGMALLTALVDMCKCQQSDPGEQPFHQLEHMNFKSNEAMPSHSLIVVKQEKNLFIE